MSGARLAVPALLLAAAGWVSAQGLFDTGGEKKPWTELEAPLPPPPRPENLIAFDAGAATAHRFYIDAPSLSVGPDGVVRYTLVIRTGGGATNVSYEGMRCETHEHKSYAFARNDGKWIATTDPQWRPIQYKDVNRHHAILYAEFFCPERHVRMVPVKQMLETLKRSSVGLR